MLSRGQWEPPSRADFENSSVFSERMVFEPPLIARELLAATLVLERSY
jgi:hypothetical protein